MTRETDEQELPTRQKSVSGNLQVSSHAAFVVVGWHAQHTVCVFLRCLKGTGKVKMQY